MKRYVVIMPEFAWFRSGKELIPLTPPNEGYLFKAGVFEFAPNHYLTDDIMVKFLERQQISLYESDEDDSDDWRLA